MTSISISQLVSYLGLLIPVFVTCSTNYGGRPGKLITCNEVLRHWVDAWMSGTFFLYSCKVASEPKKRCQDCLMLSAQLFYGPCLQSVGSSFTCGFSGTVPLHHTFYKMSRYVTEHDQFYQASPCISTASDKCWGGRLGYQDYRWIPQHFFTRQLEGITHHADC